MVGQSKNNNNMHAIKYFEVNPNLELSINNFPVLIHDQYDYCPNVSEASNHVPVAPLLIVAAVVPFARPCARSTNIRVINRRRLAAQRMSPEAWPRQHEDDFVLCMRVLTGCSISGQTNDRAQHHLELRCTAFDARKLFQQFADTSSHVDFHN